MITDIEHQDVGPLELYMGSITNLHGIRPRVELNPQLSIAHNDAMYVLAPVHVVANGALLDGWRFAWPTPEHGQVENPLFITSSSDWDEIV